MIVIIPVVVAREVKIEALASLPVARINPREGMILPTSFVRNSIHPVDVTLYLAIRSTTTVDNFVVGTFVIRRPTVIMTNTESVTHVES